MSSQTGYWRVPAHITGLFQIVQHENPLQMGSRGAGFSLERSSITRIISEKATQTEIKVLYNGQVIDGKVSLAVVSNFEEYIGNLSLTIEHRCDYPMQAGFGTSGAGALGTALALDELFNLEMPMLKIGQMAHVAEVSCRTGLGDVIAQLQGGAEIREEPGAPGIGIINKFEWPENLWVLTATMGTISTKDIITDPKMITSINTNSVELLNELKQNPTVEEFVRVSYEFANKTDLLKGSLKELVDNLRQKGFMASMVMLGESLFVVGEKKSLIECKKILSNKYPNALIWIDPINYIGPVVVGSSKHKKGGKK